METNEDPSPTQKKTDLSEIKEAVEAIAYPPRSTFWQTLERGAKKEFRGIPLSLLLGIPAFFSVLIPSLFKSIGQISSFFGYSDEVAPTWLYVIFETFLLVYFLFPLLYLFFRAASVEPFWQVLFYVGLPLGCACLLALPIYPIGSFILIILLLLIATGFLLLFCVEDDRKPESRKRPLGYTGQPFQGVHV